MFVDHSVEDPDALLRGLRRGAAGYVLDRDRDGVQQIAETLALRSGLSAVSVVAHGSAGSVGLGATRLDEAGLPLHAADLRAIGRALTPDGALQLFACEAGKGSRGRALVNALSEATGTAVMAASRVLGGGAEGRGEWSLDVRSAPGVASPGLPIAADVLQTYEHALSGAGSPPAGFPLDITDFSTNGGSFVTSGNAMVNGSALQLTADQTSEAGSAVYDQSFSSTASASPSSSPTIPAAATAPTASASSC